MRVRCNGRRQMDRRRAAGALLALAVCIASSDAAPTASNQTALDLYEGASEGCYYNFQHYGEGDRIMTNEPCLNCTCHNRMLMCYLRVCPFTKPIGQDCTVEKRADQCCPIVTCPDVPVDLLTSTSTTSPAEYGGTGVGKLDKYGCSINGKYFPEGSKVPPTPNKPCEHCYCIRNMTTCVMQECTLHVDGCTPIYHKDVCCPVRYSCDHPEDEMLLLDDMTTTVRPTPGFLLTTTTLSPVTQMSQDCVHEDRIVPDGALIKTEKACEHCYCMKGDIVCVVQECGTPMENEGKNCTSQPPREGQCCPDTYICEGDDVSTEVPTEFTTAPSEPEEITTLSPPRRVGVEGSGYRKETEESYTEMPLFETETEGSGYDHEIGPSIDSSSEKQTSDIIPETTEDILYITSSTAKTPTLEEIEKSTEPDKGLNTVPSGLFDDETSETPLQTTVFEAEKITESSGISEKDTSEDNTVVPELFTSHEITNKQEVVTTTVESVFRKEDEINEVTDRYEHTEPEKTSTPHIEMVEYTTSLFEHVTSETNAPTDEKLTTEMPIIKPIEEKETTTHSFIEISTSAGTSKPLREEEVIYETTSYTQATTQGLSEDSSEEEHTHDSDDITKQKEATTALLLESSTPVNKADDEDTMKESDKTTEHHIDISTPAEPMKPSDVIDEVTEKVDSTKSSEDSDKTVKEKESSTTIPSETGFTSTETKETSTESLLEVSTHVATSKHSDEVSSESIMKDKEVTTEYSLEIATSAKETKPSDTQTTTVTDVSDQIITTTDKTSLLETTNIDNQENEVEGFARIPGEGDCLLNSITYRNNSKVPSTNNCHTDCRCVSSIVKCDPIICSPPPEYMDNCQPTYDSPDSCCPTYICHTGETMPPQPDSHMSGTDKPVPSSTAECHGEECVLKQGDDTSASSEKPAVGECGMAGCDSDIKTTPECHGEQCIVKQSEESPVISEKPAISDCGPNGCGDNIQTTPECHGEECIIKQGGETPVTSDKPAVSDCGPAGCSDDSQTTPDCHGEECIIKHGEEPLVTSEKPAVSDCGPAGCDGDVKTTPECHGEQCIIKQGEESPVASEKPAVSDCGPAGCDGDIQTKIECDGDECTIKQGEESPVTSEKPAVSDCGPAGCGDDSQTTPDCHGEQCIIKHDEEPLVTSEKPAVSDCGPAGCDSDVKTTPECHGEQCIIKQGEESPAASEKPAVSECGPSGCDGDIETKLECVGEECTIKQDEESPVTSEKPVVSDGDLQTHPHISSAEKDSTESDCAGENCQAALPTKPCDGKNCDIEPVLIPVKDISLCQNKDDCQPQVIPCEGETCKPADCNTADCSPGTVPISPPIEKDHIIPGICSDKDDCQKQEDEPKLPCTEDSCRRKDTGGELETVLPIDCTSAECKEQKPETDGEKVESETETQTEPESLKPITPEGMLQQTEKSPTDIQTETSTNNELPETITESQQKTSSEAPQETSTDATKAEEETSSKAPQEVIPEITKVPEEIPSKSPEETKTETTQVQEQTTSKSLQETESFPTDVSIETSTIHDSPGLITETMSQEETSSSQSPQKEEEYPIDITTKISSEHMPTESTTEPLIIEEGTPQKSPHTEKSPTENEEVTLSSESLSTIAPSSEHSSQPTDFTLKISELTTENDEIVTHTEPTTQFEHVTILPQPSVTEPKPREESTHINQEIDIAKLTTVSDEEQYTTKPSEQKVTEREKPETIITQLPEAFETATESQQTSITESREVTTVSSLDAATETFEQTGPTEGLKSTDVPHSMTTATVDKQSSELPEYITPESQEGIETTSSTLEQEVTEGSKIPETEKETLSPVQHMPQQPDENTTEKHVSATDTSHSSTLSQETVTSAYLPSDVASSSINQEDDKTTSVSPQESHSQTIKTVEVTEKSTSITESHGDIVTTDETKQEDKESTTESVLTKDEEEQTKAPVTNVPKLPEDITATTTEDFVTIKSEMIIPDNQKEIESSETPVTISDEMSTTSKDIPVTDKSTKETDLYTTKKYSMAPTESSFTEQDKQTEYPISLSSEPTKEGSSTLMSTLSDSETVTSKSPDVTYGPTEILVTTEVEEVITTEKVLVSEATDLPLPFDEDVGTKQPIPDITERIETIKEESTTAVVKELTEQPTVIAEDDFRTNEPPRVTEKVMDVEQSASTEKSTVDFKESLATTEQSAQSSKPIDSETTTASVSVQDGATEISQMESESTLTDHEKVTEKMPEQIDEKEEKPTESPVQTYTESQDFETKTSSVDIVTPIPEDSGKETILPEIPDENPVTEREVIKNEKSPSTDKDMLYSPTEIPDQVVTKEDIGTKTPENLFTDKDLPFVTQSEDEITKIYTEEPETYTEIPVSVTEQEKESETSSISDSEPEIKEQTQEPSLSNVTPTVIIDVEKEPTQSVIIPSEISTKSPAMPESHVKEEDQGMHTSVTSPIHIQTTPLPEEVTHTTISELQTEELLEVTKKPQESTIDPHAKITELTSESVTDAVQKEIITENPLDYTTAEISEITLVPLQDKTTLQTDEIITKLPDEIVSQEPQVPVTDKYPKDTPVESQTETSTSDKEISTEKAQKPLDTDTMTYEEKTTQQPEEVVTDVGQDKVTMLIEETSKEGLTGSIEVTTKSVIDSEDILTKGPEITITSSPQEQSTDGVHETIPEEQEKISTKLPEIKDSKYDELTDKPKSSTSAYEFTTPAADEVSTKITEISPGLPDEEILKTEAEDITTSKYDISKTTPYVVELEEHTHKTIEETSTTLPEDLESESKPTESHVDLSTEKDIITEGADFLENKKDQSSTSLPSDEITKQSDQELEKSTPSFLPSEDIMSQTTTPASEISADKHDDMPSVPTQPQENVPPTSELVTPLPEIKIPVQTEKTPSSDVRIPEQEILPITSKTTTSKAEEDISTPSPISKPEERPAEPLPPSDIPETPKPGFNEILPTDEIPEEEGHFPPSGGYGQEPDYVEEDQAFGPGTCRYGGKVYVSAQQIPRDDPCDFCFCFRSDIICLQQSCPPPIHGCHEEPIQGFCCPRYECPVAMATSLNVTTTTTTTTTTLPPHFLPHAYKGAAQRRGCQIKGHTYKVGEVVRASSGPCLHCTCGGDGQMKCDPKACTPEPMLRQMIAAAVSAKRRR
ncbi:unnamed protein product [Diatraea saccharalis]|uniref:VWFC domain-containing protein n=1 Tax=Diatraea saccharalis TaxID=40085 RepID=A0A9N9QUT0_9NEOP|nr:unnamed protein product [Diatraea saccharalis]